MNNQTFLTRRGTSANASSYSRNRNRTAYTKKGLGNISYGLIVGMLTLIVGLIYVGQGAQGTSFDYQISEVENEIAEMQAKKEDLAVEQARLTSIASASNNEIAVSMNEVATSGYVSE